MTEYKKTYKKGTYGKKESRKDESTETRKHIVWINGTTESLKGGIKDLRNYGVTEPSFAGLTEKRNYESKENERAKDKII